MSSFDFGRFASGLATGIPEGQRIALRQNELEKAREEREARQRLREAQAIPTQRQVYAQPVQYEAARPTAGFEGPMPAAEEYRPGAVTVTDRSKRDFAVMREYTDQGEPEKAMQYGAAMQRMYHQRAMEGMDDVQTRMAQGDMEGAAEAMQQAYQWFPNGMDAVVLPVGDKLMAVAIDPETGAQTGGRIVISQDNLAKMKERFQDPNKFMVYNSELAKGMREARREPLELKKLKAETAKLNAYAEYLKEKKQPAGIKGSDWTSVMKDARAALDKAAMEGRLPPDIADNPAAFQRFSAQVYEAMRRDAEFRGTVVGMGGAQQYISRVLQSMQAEPPPPAPPPPSAEEAPPPAAIALPAAPAERAEARRQRTEAIAAARRGERATAARKAAERENFLSEARKLQRQHTRMSAGDIQAGIQAVEEAYNAISDPVQRQELAGVLSNLYRRIGIAEKVQTGTRQALPGF